MLVGACAVNSVTGAGIDRANAQAVSNVARIKDWRILPKEFSVEGGELSPSLKVKRFRVLQLYQKVVQEMY